MKINFLDNYYFFYEILIILFLSLIPCFVILFSILHSDRKRKEPIISILMCIFSGFLIIGLAIFFGDNFKNIYYTSFLTKIDYNNILFVFGNSFVEEGSKLLFFLLFIYGSKKFDDLYDGIVYLGIIALSFAGLENMLYAFNENTFVEGVSLAIIRDITTIPLHLICGVVMGYYISLSKFSKNYWYKILNLTKSLGIPFILHGLYNNLLVLISSNPYKEPFFAISLLMLFMLLLFVIVQKVISKNKKLDKLYMGSSPFPKKYRYLLNYNDFKKDDI